MCTVCVGTIQGQLGLKGRSGGAVVHVFHRCNTLKMFGVSLMRIHVGGQGTDTVDGLLRLGLL